MIAITESNGLEEFYVVFEQTQQEVPFQHTIRCRYGTWATLKYANKEKENLEQLHPEKSFRVFKIQVQAV